MPDAFDRALDDLKEIAAKRAQTQAELIRLVVCSQLCVPIAKQLLRMSAGDYFRRQFLIQAAERLDKMSRPELDEWWLDDAVKPAKKKPSKNSVWYRDLNIEFLIWRAVNVHDLKATRNPKKNNAGTAPCKAGGSGCDAAGMAVESVGIHLSYSSYQNIWRRRNLPVPDSPALNLVQLAERRLRGLID